MKPVTFTPERWYMIWNGGLVALALVVVVAMFYWLGPIVIQRGLERWEKQKAQQHQ